MEPEDELWEQEWNDLYNEKNMKRMYKTAKHYCDPRKEAMRDYRNQRSGMDWYHGNENKAVKEFTKRKFRQRMCLRLLNEEYYRLRPRDWKTYGWMTW